MFDFARKVGARGLVVAAIAAGAVLTSSPADARGYGYRGGWHGGGWGCCAIGLGFYDPLWPGYYAGGYWGPGYPYYATPPVTVVQQPMPAQAPLQAAPQSYYYCDNPGGYYPYVQSCSVPWRQVPATPMAQPGQ